MKPSYRIVSYRIEKKTLISYRYHIESKKSLSLFIGLNVKTVFYQVAHNELRAHGKAVAVYRLPFVSHIVKIFGEKKSLTLKQPCFEVVSCSGVNLLNRGAKSV